jgi:ubiquitin-conjugating enzyme E2 variant
MRVEQASSIGMERPTRVRQRPGYSAGARRFEIASIGVYALVMVWLAWRLARPVLDSPWLGLSALMTGFVLADFISGVLHWSADTWGTPEWPIVGKALIRPFREHHLDQHEITRHDFIEANGNTCLISLPVVFTALLPLHPGAWAFFAEVMFAAALSCSLTNQFHKWAHMDAPPRLVRLLQRANLILSPEHHALHHAAPFQKYYCITVGWLNEPLHRARVFETLERLVTATTGLVPRADGRSAESAAADEPLAACRGLASKPN